MISVLEFFFCVHNSIIKRLKDILCKQTHSSQLYGHCSDFILKTQTHPDTSNSDPFLVLRRWLAVTGNWLECPAPSKSAPAIDAERFSRSRRCDEESESIPEPPETLPRLKSPMTEPFGLCRLVSPPECPLHVKVRKDYRTTSILPRIKFITQKRRRWRVIGEIFFVVGPRGKLGLLNNVTVAIALIAFPRQCRFSCCWRGSGCIAIDINSYVP